MSGGEDALRAGRSFAVPAAIRAALLLAAILTLTSSGPVLANAPQEGAATEVSAPTPVWSINLFDASATRDQDPDMTACSAAAAQSMLNIIALATDADLPPPRGGSLPVISFAWNVDTSYATQETILEYEREHMTMYWSSPGTDPHGWRNALNTYGWGSMYAGVYRDSAYDSFAAAAVAVVHSMATTHKPVGILGWYGGHAQYVTGYMVRGEDPRVSDNYTILGVYLTDPLHDNNTYNTLVSYWTWQNGSYYLRFAPYYYFDSPFSDVIDGRIGNYEWWGKWVIVDAVK